MDANILEALSGALSPETRKSVAKALDGDKKSEWLSEAFGRVMHDAVHKKYKTAGKVQEVDKTASYAWNFFSILETKFGTWPAVIHYWLEWNHMADILELSLARMPGHISRYRGSDGDVLLWRRVREGFDRYLKPVSPEFGEMSSMLERMEQAFQRDIDLEREREEEFNRREEEDEDFDEEAFDEEMAESADWKAARKTLETLQREWTGIEEVNRLLYFVFKPDTYHDDGRRQ